MIFYQNISVYGYCANSWINFAFSFRNTQFVDVSVGILIGKPDALICSTAEDRYPTWRENFEQWKLTGGDHAYHYLGSAIWFTRIGHECAEAMIELMDR